jgi:hypothetical protein
MILYWYQSASCRFGIFMMNPGVYFSVQFSVEVSFLGILKIEQWFYREWFSPGNQFFLKNGCRASNGFSVKITQVRGQPTPIFINQEQAIHLWIAEMHAALSRHFEVYIGFGRNLEAAQDDLNRILSLQNTVE